MYLFKIKIDTNTKPVHLGGRVVLGLLHHLVQLVGKEPFTEPCRTRFINYHCNLITVTFGLI